MAPQLRDVIGTVPEVDRVISQLGRPDDGTDVTGFFNIEFGAPLKPMEQWRKKPFSLFGHRLWDQRITREDMEKELMEKFKEFPGINFNFSQYIRDNVEEALSGVKGANSVKIEGTDLDQLEVLGQKLTEILKTVPGIENVGMFHVVGQPNLQIEIDRGLCARHGVNVAEVEKVVQVAIGGEAFSQMVEREKLFDIVLRLPPELRNDPQIIGRILVDVPGTGDDSPGYRVPLSQLAEIKAHESGGRLHLPREQPAVPPDQVQRARPRPGLGHRRGPEEGGRPRDRDQAARRATRSAGPASSSRCSRPTIACCSSSRCRSASS